jgi:hypothetical protein
MSFVDAVALLKRHKLLAIYGLLVACLLATFSAYRLDGTALVSRSAPMYESKSVVAVRPGSEHPTTTTIPPTTLPAPPPAVADPAAADPAAATTTPATTTTVATPPLAPLSAVIDSRAMYYTALSLKTIVVSPGFAEAVKARAPMMDGSVTAVVAQDTNTMDVVVDGSTPAVATTTMTAALTELQSVVAAYSATPATRFGLDGVVISAPSAPAATSSIKEPLTFVIVLTVVLVLWWFLIRAVDQLAQARRRSKAAPANADHVPPPPAVRVGDARAPSSNGQRNKPTAPVR